MALSKVDQKVFPFFREVHSANTSDIFDNFYYDLLTLEIAGAVNNLSLRIQGCVNIESADKTIIPDGELSWCDLAAISVHDFSVQNVVTEPGIYSIAISGIRKVRVVLDSLDGTATVIGIVEA